MYVMQSSSIRTGFIALLALMLLSCSGGEPAPVATSVSLPAARGLVPDLEVSDHFFEDAHFNGSGSCSGCHDDQEVGENAVMVDSLGRDLSIVKAWRSSMMANATRDPYWHAVVAKELALYPELEDEINDVCSRCHAPMANEIGRRTGEPLQLFDKGSEAEGTLVKGVLSLDSTSDVFNHAMDGVSCTVCHQFADDGNLGTDAGMTGGFKIEQYSEANAAERPAYGQYSDVDPGYMKGLSNFTPVYAAHISTSETCGTCHNLKSTSVDRHGVPIPDAGPFPEQMIFTEWQNSDYNVGGALQQTCQDCHMPKLTDRDIPIAGAGAGGVVRSNFAEHTFLGANTVMLEILRTGRQQLGIANDIDFLGAIERNQQFLRTAAEVNILASGITNNKLALKVEILNKTGHKLPSGYHSRRAFIHVLVTDENGQVVYENGHINADGSIDGVSEDNNPDTYEPHYDVINSNTEVQVYQAIMGNSEDIRTHSLLNSTYYLKDNRLTPVGFNKAAVVEDIAVTGKANTDGNFGWGRDVVNYNIPVTGSNTLNVFVELVYQPLSYGHLKSLFMMSDVVDEVDQFRTLYNSTTLRSEQIAAASVSVQP